MSRLEALVDRHVKRGRYVTLVTHPDDTLELADLATGIAQRRGDREPLLVRTEDQWNDALADEPHVADDRGIVFPRAHLLAEQPSAFLRRIFCVSPPRRLVIANFTSALECAMMLESMPKDVSRMFIEEPIEWPTLHERTADLDGIIERICARLMSQDERIRAMLAPDAKQALICDRRDHVASLRSRIRDAFDLMLKDGGTVITKDHLRGRTSHAITHRVSPSSRPAPPA